MATAHITKSIMNGKTKIRLPSSKSISNRALMIRALCDEPFVIQNLSDADDTQLMDSLFRSGSSELYVKNAGTVARFMLAYYATRESDVILRGNPRMNERPIGALVDALNALGAKVEYMDAEGYLPIHIYGRPLMGDNIIIPANISSQFISALLLAGPVFEDGLSLTLTGEIVSRPYIELTLKMMDYFGVWSREELNLIHIPPQKYIPKTFFVESDWSSASYMLALLALYPGNVLVFENLFENSWQGDSIQQQLFSAFGLQFVFEETTCTVRSGFRVSDYFEFDFTACPDLSPTFVCLCCATQIPFYITGTKTLKDKESDRGSVLQSELKKCGFTLEVSDNSILYKGGRETVAEAEIILDPCQDHRMAMSFAILAVQNKNISIKDPEVVKKSFPGFWDELKQIGFETELINK